MPAPVTLLLLIFWLVLAYRAFQRGDVLLAGLFLAVGIVLTIYRFRRAGGARAPEPGKPIDPH